jgi:hypothetical protein
MTTTILVDSRAAVSGSGSDFSVLLRETVRVAAGARIRVDKLRFVDSFFTTDMGRFLYYKDGSGSIVYYGLPEQAYSGTRLAAQIQLMTGRTTSYSEQTNSIQQVVFAGQEWLSDADLKAYVSGFPPGASGLFPSSINSVLGPGGEDASGNLVWSFVKMSPYEDLYLRSRKLACQNVHGPIGDHDVICKVTLDQGISKVQSDQSPPDVWNDITESSFKTLDFKLTDYLGRVVNLRGRSLSFQLTIDQ